MGELGERHMGLGDLSREVCNSEEYYRTAFRTGSRLRQGLGEWRAIVLCAGNGHEMDLGSASIPVSISSVKRKSFRERYPERLVYFKTAAPSPSTANLAVRES